MSFTTSEITQQHIDSQLDLLRDQLGQQQYPGYPEQSNRFSSAHQLGQLACDCLAVPDGPWNVNIHLNRPDTEILPAEPVQSALLSQGYRLDKRGRPVHPWFEQMVADPAIGVVGGKGFYWSWGPNRTADPLVLHRGRLLLVQRNDTGTWALPGGFINSDETAFDASVRELREETKLVLPADHPAKILYDGPVADPRVTANAWPETVAIAHLLESDELAAQAQVGDTKEVQAVRWVPFDELAQYPLFGAHRLLAQLALNQ